MARSTWGSIRTLRKGYHEIRYTVEGSQRSEYVKGTKADAERRRAELRLEYEDCTGADLKVKTFWRKTYWPECRSLAESTKAEYERVYRRNIEPKWGARVMRSIRAAEVQEWLDGMTYGKARSTRAIMRAMFNRAFDLELIDRNVMSKRFKLPSARAKGGRTEEVYTAAELDEIFEDCEGEVWEPAFILAAFGSASREEAMSPMLDEIWFAAYDGDGEGIEVYAVVPIVRGVQRLGGEVKVIDKTKNEYRERSLVVPPPYSARLRDLVDEKVEAGDTWLMDDGFGWPIDPDVMATCYKRWFLGKPYRYIPFSNLRNSYNTMMHAKGIDLWMVSKLMGHSKPDTSYKHYDRPGIGELIRVVSRANSESRRNDKGNLRVINP